jgi:hypothetical protein
MQIVKIVWEMSFSLGVGWGGVCNFNIAVSYCNDPGLASNAILCLIQRQFTKEF